MHGCPRNEKARPRTDAALLEVFAFFPARLVPLAIFEAGKPLRNNRPDNKFAVPPPNASPRANNPSWNRFCNVFPSVVYKIHYLGVRHCVSYHLGHLTSRRVRPPGGPRFFPRSVNRRELHLHPLFLFPAKTPGSNPAAADKTYSHAARMRPT